MDHVQQPMMERMEVFDRAGWGYRLIAGAVSAACLALLGVAAWLPPSPTGIGTHCNLGLPPCSWAQLLDLPCPTCGMTTAFAHLANGDFVASFIAQPMGFVLAVAVSMAFWVGLMDAIVGSQIGRSMAVIWKPWLVWGLGGLALASWLYKIWVFE